MTAVLTPDEAADRLTVALALQRYAQCPDDDAARRMWREAIDAGATALDLARGLRMRDQWQAESVTVLEAAIAHYPAGKRRATTYTPGGAA